MTKELFRDDSYIRESKTRIVSVADRGICLEETIFYPRGGGQPGDTGVLVRADGTRLEVLDTLKDNDTGEIFHKMADGIAPPEPGEEVVLQLDWDRRYRLMRMHSCMHLLCSVVPAGVTGGSIRDGSARLDFDLPDPPDKQAIEGELNRLIGEDHPLRIRSISDSELDAQPELVRTMSVQPPRGGGRIRLIEILRVDLQPCGGTHVSRTSEIGPVKIKKIEKKGKRNRRITIEFDD